MDKLERHDAVTKPVWGWMLSLDCGSCDLAKITSYSNIYSFAKALVERINMIAYGEPQIVNFGEGNKEGYTLVQLISTSNICAHFSNDERSIYFDCFSCKPFDNEVVKGTVIEFFGAATIKEYFIERQA